MVLCYGSTRTLILAPCWYFVDVPDKVFALCFISRSGIQTKGQGRAGEAGLIWQEEPRRGHKNDAGDLRGPCPVPESGSRDARGDAACSQVEDVGVGNGGSHRQATAHAKSFLSNLAEGGRDASHLPGLGQDEC